MQYKVTIDFSYDLESEKDHDELLKNLEQELNDLTKGIILNKRQIRLNKMKAVKHKIRIATFTPEELLPHVVKEGKKEFIIDGNVYTVRMDSSRYFVFRRSLECVACGIKGSKMILEINQHDKSPHFNLYAEENGKLILMTKDHIHPKSKGGKNEIENYATMCAICNNLKGNDESLTDESIRALRIIYNENKNLPRKQFRELLDLEKSKISKNHVKVIRKVKMKKTKGAERLERIQKETNKLLCLVANTENEDIIAQIKSLMKVVNDSVAECEEDVVAHTKSDDAGRWHVVSLGPDGQCSGFHTYKNGRDAIVKEIVHATEFMSKKDAQRVCDLLGKTYSVVGFPDKR